MNTFKKVTIGILFSLLIILLAVYFNPGSDHEHEQSFKRENSGIIHPGDSHQFKHKSID